MKSRVRAVISSVYAMPYRRRSSFVTRASIVSTLALGLPGDRGRRPTWSRLSSAMNRSISFSSRGFARVLTRESVTPAIADTTTNLREGSVWTAFAMRSYISASLTQLPPNFATFHASAKVPSPMRELRIQDAAAGTAAEGVVREDEESEIAIRHANPADRRGHPACSRRLSGPEVQQRLGPVLLRPDKDRLPGRRRQLISLRLASERRQDLRNVLGTRVLLERDGDRLKVAIPHGDASAVRPYVDRARHDPVGPAAENLLRLPPNLLLLVLDEGQHVPRNVERRHAWIPGPREGLVRGNMDLREVECTRERPEREHESGDGAIRIRHEHAAFLERRLALDERDVVRVDLGHQERHVGLHPVRRGVREDSDARARGVDFEVVRDIGRQGAERRNDPATDEPLDIERLNLHPGDPGGEGHVLEPPKVAETSADLSLRGTEGDNLEDRMVLEQADEPLADRPGRPEDGHGNLRQSGVPPAKYARASSTSRRNSDPSGAYVAFRQSSRTSRIRRSIAGVCGFNAWMSRRSAGGSARSPAAAMERRENVVPAGRLRPARSKGLWATHLANVRRQRWLSPRRNAMNSSWWSSETSTKDAPLGRKSSFASRTATALPQSLKVMLPLETRRPARPIDRSGSSTGALRLAMSNTSALGFISAIARRTSAETDIGTDTATTSASWTARRRSGSNGNPSRGPAVSLTTTSNPRERK